MFDFLGAHFETVCNQTSVFAEMPRRNIVRERNERGFHLFLQNLKGVLSICESDEVFWTEDLIEETTKRLQDSYTTLTLIEHDWHDMSMVAEHSHKKDGQICAAISKKKRKKIIFLQK